MNPNDQAAMNTVIMMEAMNDSPAPKGPPPDPLFLVVGLVLVVSCLVYLLATSRRHTRC